MNISNILSTRRFFGSVLLLLTLVSILVPPTMAEISQAETDLTGVSIAIYAGGASEGHNESRKALIEMFEWMNVSSIQEVVGEDVRNGVLDDVDIFVMPSTSPYTLIPDLQSEGVEIFEEFIRNGGSFFGIVSGSYYEWDDYFHFNDFFLYSGEMNCEAYGYGQIIVNISINTDSEGPDLTSQPKYLDTTYWDSGHFSDYEEDVNIVANYTGTDMPVMIAYEKWNGTVFLSTLHPEFEENDNRDNSTFLDSCDDPDSEWNLMLSVSRWLIEESVVPSAATSTTSLETTTTQTAGINLGSDALVVIGIAAVAIIIVVVALKKVHV